MLQWWLQIPLPVCFLVFISDSDGDPSAVVAAILKAGLRIMPHACGRVGKGLYLASERSKCADYVSCGRKGSDWIGVNP